MPRLSCTRFRRAHLEIVDVLFLYVPYSMSWAAPTVSYLWSTRTGLSHGKFRKIGNSLAEHFCDLSRKLPRHGNSDPLMSFKERVFHASHFCDLYRSCDGTQIISEAPFFGCNFFNYSWKLPTYSGAFLLTVAFGSLFT